MPAGDPAAEGERRSPDGCQQHRQQRVEDGDADQPRQVAAGRRERREQQHVDQLRHHRAVLVRAVDGVTDPAVGVEAQGQGLQPLDELEAQELVHALQDPDLVVDEPEHRCRDRRGQDQGGQRPVPSQRVA
jgi:hypothetical protein